MGQFYILLYEDLICLGPLYIAVSVNVHSLEREGILSFFLCHQCGDEPLGIFERCPRALLFLLLLLFRFLHFLFYLPFDLSLVLQTSSGTVLAYFSLSPRLANRWCQWCWTSLATSL